MKKDIHPNYQEAIITCVCGNVIHTRSTRPKAQVEVCSKCHPFYTGAGQKVVEGGRVEKFRKRYAGNLQTKP